MRRLFIISCVIMLAIFATGIAFACDFSVQPTSAGYAVDPPGQELAFSKTMKLELSQNFPNPFNDNRSTWDNIIETKTTEYAADNSRKLELNVDNNMDNTAFVAQFSIKEYESALGDIYFSKASQTGAIDKIMDAGQKPKDIVVGSVDSFIYKTEFDLTVAGQMVYPLIA